MKNWMLIAITWLLCCCDKEPYVTLSGRTMGTYYSIQYKSDKNYKAEIDSLLKDFISAASTYDSESELSEFNRNGTVYFKTKYLYEMLSIAKVIHKQTDGAFEPTLMPLINLHGFGYTKKQTISPAQIDSLRPFVSFNYIIFDSAKMTALKKGVQVDLSAMGEGFAIDLIADFLEHNHVWNYKVEIGGEMKCKGNNPENERWLVGIENPSGSEKGEMISSVRLKDEAISTSGSYRKFYLDSFGRKHSHIIDPRSGRPVQNNLLSVTIKGNKAVTADAIATACMVMSLERAINFIESSAIKGMISYEEDGKIQYWHSTDFFN